MKNKITVIYPDEFTASFVIQTDGPADHYELLERIFDQWNNGSGYESELFLASEIRSLSVNDIVCVNDTYYQCAGVGWNEVNAEYINQLETEVANHWRRRVEGAHFVLSLIMWDRNKTKNLAVI